MRKHIITLGGLPGSGKSTVSRILAEKLGYKIFSTGNFVREMAAERNLTLEEFNDLITHDQTLDHLIDGRLKEIESHEDAYIIDSHLAFHFVPSGLSVLLDIPLAVSAERVFKDCNSPSRVKSGDVMGTLEEASQRTKRRIENHKERYMRIYGVVPYVPENYNLIVDASTQNPEEIAQVILKEYEGWTRES